MILPASAHATLYLKNNNLWERGVCARLIWYFSAAALTWVTVAADSEPGLAEPSSAAGPAERRSPGPRPVVRSEPRPAAAPAAAAPPGGGWPVVSGAGARPALRSLLCACSAAATVPAVI